MKKKEGCIVPEELNTNIDEGQMRDGLLLLDKAPGQLSFWNRFFDERLSVFQTRN